MDRHICRQCNKVFNYCRSCVFKPIPWKEAGFCSKECSAEFKKSKTEEVIREDVEVVVIDEGTSTSEKEKVECPQFFTATEEEVIEEKEENKEDGDLENYREELRTE